MHLSPELLAQGRGNKSRLPRLEGTFKAPGSYRSWGISIATATRSQGFQVKASFVTTTWNKKVIAVHATESEPGPAEEFSSTYTSWILWFFQGWSHNSLIAMDNQKASEVRKGQILGKSLNLHYCWEVIVHKDHVGSFFADICTRLPHCNPNIGRFQSHGIINTISCHWHNGTSSLQSLWGRREEGLWSQEKSCWQSQDGHWTELLHSSECRLLVNTKRNITCISQTTQERHAAGTLTVLS